MTKRKKGFAFPEKFLDAWDAWAAARGLTQEKAALAALLHFMEADVAEREAMIDRANNWLAGEEPGEAVAAWRGSLKARRIAAGGGSGGNRKPPARRRIGSRRPGFGYDPHAYCRAIARACRRAGIVPWHPHQLRHAFGTRAREAFDLEHSQAALGHAHARTAEIYAMISQRKAEAVARRIG